MGSPSVKKLCRDLDDLSVAKEQDATPSTNGALATPAAGYSKGLNHNFSFDDPVNTNASLTTSSPAPNPFSNFKVFFGPGSKDLVTATTKGTLSVNFEAAFPSAASSTSASIQKAETAITYPQVLDNNPSRKAFCHSFVAQAQGQSAGFDLDITKHSSDQAAVKLTENTPSIKETNQINDQGISGSDATARRPAPQRKDLIFRGIPVDPDSASKQTTITPTLGVSSNTVAAPSKSSQYNPKTQPIPVDTMSHSQSQRRANGATKPAPPARRGEVSLSSGSANSDSDEDDDFIKTSARNNSNDPEEVSVTEDGDSSRDSEEDDTHVSEEEHEVEEELIYHTGLLQRLPGEDDLNEIRSSPLFTQPVWKYAKTLPANSRDSAFTQYALLGANSDTSGSEQSKDAGIFYNIAAPSSVFICGNQGSGKSHTLSCFLENCLIPSNRLGSLPRPLTGIVFHYDTFISDVSGTPCEAAYLATHPKVKVRVLCAPTNIRTMKQIYSQLPGVTVEELRLKESDLNTKRMLDLMAVGSGSMPLYIHIIQRVLRDMRIQQQVNGLPFNYAQFKRMLEQENLTPMQSVPLQQRLDTLESFMVKSQTQIKPLRRTQAAPIPQGTDWTPKAGQLTIVDLSCPCVTAEMACTLFNICLSLFLEQKDSSIGRIAALDEAHKYMGESPEAQTLTNSLLSTIRLQRHLALRVIISTQEPTVSPKLLDLCSITVVHRFQSPGWLQVLKGHLAGLSTASQILIRDEKTRQEQGDDSCEQASVGGIKGISIAPQNPALEMMSHIVKLKTGEALIFAPSAFVGLETKTTQNGESIVVPRRLDHEVMRIRMRARITADGGRSIMAA